MLRALFGAFAICAALADGVAAQDPDSVLVVPPPDSLSPGVTVVPLDSGVVVDTVFTTHPDSVFRPLPGLTGVAPAVAAAGVRVWNRDELLSTSALTLRELLAREPDLLPLRYGDYGAPETVLGPGMAGGRVRVLIDGYEELPFEGGVPDLAGISLAGVQEVRLTRSAGEIRIDVHSLDPFDVRPMSRVEAGTGDLDTNLFRGTFLHPRAFGGTLGLSIERVDTEGRGGNEPGSRQAVWFRYARHFGDDFALAFDLRTRTSEVELDGLPPSIDRGSWAVRARWRPAAPLVVEAFTGSTSISADDDGLTPLDDSRRQHGVRVSLDRGFGSAATESTPSIQAAGADTAAVDPEPAVPAPVDTTAVDPGADPVVDPAAATDPVAADSAAAAVAESSIGGDLPAGAAVIPPPPVAPGRLWMKGEARILSGFDLPSRRIDLEGGVEWRSLGGVAVDYRNDTWADPVREETASATGLRAWTAPFFGVSLFAGWDSGVRGAGIGRVRVAIPEPDTTDAPVPPDTLPYFHLSDRTATRAGARIAVGPLDVVGAWHRVEVDSILPVGLLGTRTGTAVAGDEVTGWEVSGSLALPVSFDGLSAVGSLMQWDTEGPYRPHRRYTGGLDFHNVYKNGNLELWTSFLVEGRDGMLLPRIVGSDETAEFVRVPFQQSWDFFLQVRVLTVRIFIRSENVTLRRNNQDFPGRLFPQTRSVYGVRWTLWN